MKEQKYMIFEGRFVIVEDELLGVFCMYKGECKVRCAAFEYNSIDNTARLHCCNRKIQLAEGEKL